MLSRTPCRVAAQQRTRRPESSGFSPRSKSSDRTPARATPTQDFTALQTDELFRNGALQVADHHGAGGNATYVYQFDYHPAQDPGRLGAAHCVELPFLFGTFDSYPYCPMLGTPSDTERALGRSFATAVFAFVATGSASDWLPYAPAAIARIRHFG
ncbi:carboxylesterase family protein [Streptomyces mirabilis]